MSPIAEHSKRKVSYFYDVDIGNCFFGEKHPMKPFRIVLTHELIMNYKLYNGMSLLKPYRATAEDMTKFHSPEYVSFLKSINSGIIPDDMKSLSEGFFLGTAENDCPIFPGLYSFSQLSAGASISAAMNLALGHSDIAINWAGGLHHAKKSEACGFCYINDIVLCILELLKFYSRVLYIDLDVHHGDGVEEAFFTTDRVMTVSFHRYGDDFFPGTGHLHDVGEGQGKNYSINVPLKGGINDDSYGRTFQQIMSKVMEVYNPSVIVIQCGADSLAGDRLGDFNVTTRGHGACVKYMRNFNVPMVLLGGGGYTVKNVSRCWCYETSIALNRPIPNALPETEFHNYFKPITSLHVKPNRIVNFNTRESLEKLVEHAHETLRNIQFAPSVQMFDIPPTFFTPPHSPTPLYKSPRQTCMRNDEDETPMVISDAPQMSHTSSDKEMASQQNELQAGETLTPSAIPNNSSCGTEKKAEMFMRCLLDEDFDKVAMVISDTPPTSHTLSDEEVTSQELQEQDISIRSNMSAFESPEFLSESDLLDEIPEDDL